MRTRRPRLPIQEMIERTLRMIEAHSERPAPTREEIMQWTGLRRREIVPFLDSLRRRGLITVRRKAGRPAHRYRYKVVGGKPATHWTQRKGGRRND